MCDININLERVSIVHWYPELEKHKCGYCEKENSAVSYGMWAEQLTVEDYQNLVDRGWRRSGMYCYKAIMDETCCPLYTIRCKADEFTPSKSQKKIIKKFNKFVNDGVLVSSNQPNEPNSSETCDESEPRIIKDKPTRCLNLHSSGDVVIEDDATSIQTPKESPASSACSKGEGADPTKPPCKKAKQLRLERRQKRLSERGMPVEKTLTNLPKTLEEFLNEIPETSKHKLKIKQERVNKNHQNFKVCAALFKKYQMAIHKELPKECGEKQFCEFLIETPLKTVRVRGENSGAVTYGTFHQQYWLDDKLIAVAVLDILPRSVSSVYFFYDPDYKFLTLGTYGALREIYLVRSLHKIAPAIEYYNMGFYIHSCPKMRYKSQFNHSFLLCPETYKWFPLEKSILKLDAAKYSRLNDDLDAIDDNDSSASDIDNIKICMYSNLMLFGEYKNKYGEQEMFNNIGKLIGKKCAGCLLFVSSQQ